MPEIARADVVGSLLRPQYLLDARNGWREGRVSEAAMHAAEDRAVAEAVALQEAAGLDAITDGEYRRYNLSSPIRPQACIALPGRRSIRAAPMRRRANSCSTCAITCALSSSS